MDEFHSCQLSPSFKVVRSARKLEALGNSLAHKSEGAARKIVQLITLNAPEDQWPVSVEMAYTMANKQGLKVLLVDTSEQGKLLSTLIDRDQATSPSIPKNELSVYAVKDSGLHLLSFPIRHNEKAVSKADIGNILEGLKAHFDLIILESETPIQNPESINFALNAEGTVLILEDEKSRIPVVNEVKNILEASGVSIIGAVLNNRHLYIPSFVYKILFRS